MLNQIIAMSLGGSHDYDKTNFVSAIFKVETKLTKYYLFKRLSKPYKGCHNYKIKDVIIIKVKKRM